MPRAVPCCHDRCVKFRVLTGTYLIGPPANFILEISGVWKRGFEICNPNKLELLAYIMLFLDLLCIAKNETGHPKKKIWPERN